MPPNVVRHNASTSPAKHSSDIVGPIFSPRKNFNYTPASSKFDYSKFRCESERYSTSRGERKAWLCERPPKFNADGEGATYYTENFYDRAAPPFSSSNLISFSLPVSFATLARLAFGSPSLLPSFFFPVSSSTAHLEIKFRSISADRPNAKARTFDKKTGRHQKRKPMKELLNKAAII